MDPPKATGKMGVFDKLTSVQKEELEHKLSLVSYDRGEVVIKQGMPGDNAVYLTAGAVKKFVGLPSGGKRIFDVVFAPGFISLLLIYDGNENPYSVTALEKSTIGLVDMSLIKNWSLQNADFAFELLNYNCIVYQNLLHKMSIMYARHLRGKLVSTLFWLGRGQAEFSLPLSRVEIGEYLGVTPENISAVLQEMKRDGMIELSGRHIKIINKERMKELAQRG
jgi:CRP/FNR family transcriptional regulator